MRRIAWETLHQPAAYTTIPTMSTPPNRQSQSNRRSNENRRGGGPRRQPEPQLGGICRVCKEAQALPHEDTCEACGARTIERTRVSVDTWLGMHAERVRELERAELSKLDELNEPRPDR
jgi:hypothetical protein